MAANCIWNILYPRRCPICDDAAPFTRKICPECEKRIRIVRQPYCYKCGKPLESSSQEYCHDCQVKKHLYVKGRAVFDYGTINQALYRFKFNGRQEYADYFGDAMARRLGREIRDWHPDYIIPVPLHKSRFHKRGYNQSALLAKRLADNIGIPYSDKLVKRQKNTKPLKELSDSQRQKNLKNAFIVSDNDVKLKTIVIIDDIYTTGSTVNEIAKVLLAKGAAKVYFASLAIGSGV